MFELVEMILGMCDKIHYVNASVRAIKKRTKHKDKVYEYYFIEIRIPGKTRYIPVQSMEQANKIAKTLQAIINAINGIAILCNTHDREAMETSDYVVAFTKLLEMVGY